MENATTNVMIRAMSMGGSRFNIIFDYTIRASDIIRSAFSSSVYKTQIMVED
jgi:hypothetical protein